MMHLLKSSMSASNKADEALKQSVLVKRVEKLEKK
jgi:hypothetical protein